MTQDFQSQENHVDKIDQLLKENEKKRVKRNRERQLRSEAANAFSFIRDSDFPTGDVYEPFTSLDKMDQAVRKQYGKTIFSTAINYLRIMAAHELFPRGTLKNQIFAKIVNGQMESIQLIPKYLGRKPLPVSQLEELKDWLFVDVALPKQKTLDFYFPQSLNGIVEQNDVDNIATIVQTVNDINLEEMGGKIFVCDGLVLDTQLLFEAKQRSYEKNPTALFIILSRFVNEHRAISYMNLLPDWLNEYVKYDNPTVLPQEFLNSSNVEKPLEVLRICLGMYPVKPQNFAKDFGKVPDSIVKAVQDMPVWYISKLQQMGFIADEFNDVKLTTEGVAMGCPPTVKDIKELCKIYE